MKLQLKEIQTKQSRHSESVCRVHPARYRHDGDYTLAVRAQRGIAVRYGMQLARIIHFPGYQLPLLRWKCYYHGPSSWLFLQVKLRAREGCLQVGFWASRTR